MYKLNLPINYKMFMNNNSKYTQSYTQEKKNTKFGR